MNAQTFIKPAKPARLVYPRLHTTSAPIGAARPVRVYNWLLRLAQRGLLWHMDDLPSECGNLKTPALWVPTFTDRQAQLAEIDRGHALDICRNAGVDIHRLCLIALWAAKRGRK